MQNRSRVAMTRRHWLQASGLSVAGLAGLSGVPWFRHMAAHAADDKGKKPKACILLWMNGGPSQLETLDPKPKHKNGGPTKAIATSQTGVHISENLPKLAKQAHRVALVRSMSTREGDHQRGSFVNHTGRVQQGPIAYPTMGSFISKELGGPDDLPPFVAINSQAFFGNSLSPGFLGPDFAALSVGGNGYTPQPQPNGNNLRVANLDHPGGVKDEDFQRRWKLLATQQEEFGEFHPDLSVRSHRSSLDRAKRMMEGRASAAFNLADEPEKLRTQYGQTTFGQGCLLARRLVEAGVGFVEVQMQGWDTHQNNFKQSKDLCGRLDSGWATLIEDLADRGMLDTTLVVWMGEFGRTPNINASRGRDHFPRAWSAAMAGAGVTPGVVGKTSKDGMTVDETPVSAQQWIASICTRLQLDAATQNMSNVGRPIRLVDPGVEPIKELS